MSSATTKQVDITGAGDVDKVLKLDVSLFKDGGSVGFQSTNTAPSNTIGEDVTVQGIKGIVNRTGVMASRSAVGSIVSAELGNRGAKKAISIIKPVDDATFLPYLIDDVISGITTVDTEFVGYNLYIEEYNFSGKVIDCLNDLAGLVYGSVVYDSEEDKYIIVSGDTTYTPPGSGGSYSVDEDTLISYEIVTEKNDKLVSFGSNLIAAAKELAKLRAAILDIAASSSIATSQTKELTDSIIFGFGTRGSFTPIPQYVAVDSIHWDEWYYDAQNFKYVNPVGDTKFVSKYTRYYKEEQVKECILEATAGGGTGTASRGKMRGLRSIGIGTTLQVLIKGISAGSSITGKGYLANLTSLGLPSITKYKADALASAGTDTPFDDCYRVLYDVVTKPVKVKISPTSTLTTTEYHPYLELKMATALYNEVQSALQAKNLAAGITTAPTDYEINAELLRHSYEVKVEIMSESTTFDLKYKGSIDSHGRVITDSGQVVLIYGTSASGVEGFYGPLEGMDMSFEPSTVTTPTTPIAGSSLLNDFFDENSIKTNLINAYNDLKTLALAQPPIAIYAPVTGTSTPGYPRLIYEKITPEPPATATTGNLVGCIYGTITGEYEGALTLNSYTSSSKLRKQLERKVKCVESRISLIIACIKHADPASGVTSTQVKTLLKTIITYQTILNRVKNEALATMTTLKVAYETALNDVITQYNGETNAKVHRATVQVVLPDSLPSIGGSLDMGDRDSGSYRVTAVSVSGVTATITGEYNA